MANMVPFNRRNSDLMNVGFGGLYNMLDDFFTEGWPLRRSLMGNTFKVDVKEDETSFTVEADLPGVKKEEVTVAMDENRLRISVAHEERIEEERQSYVHRERSFISMQRNIILGNADAANIKAKLVDGVLTVTVPKLEPKANSVNIDVE